MEDLYQWVKETNIQSALIGAGLAWIASLYNKSQQNKSKLSELIQEIESLSIEHWCSSPTDTNNHFRAIKIQSKLQTLSWRVGGSNYEVRLAIIGYRKAITNDDFGETNRQFVIFESSRVQLIQERARELRQKLGLKKYH